ncbi:hypothetical protein WJX81_004602 [Elliptochloris bilobata]|uniref:Response regulatory domain-containing protein n=1 Tax=Elliptochloris bilobata TaxID=381761 RepID=A0AAW1QVH6_9CHLO
MALPGAFSARTGFPAGLEVLLVAEQDVECSKLIARLGELNYKVTLFSSAGEAAAYLASPPGQAIELLLAEARAMAPESEAGCRLRAAASALPLLLMVDALSPYSAVMHGIELGAVDVLEKPLSSLKLRNIWQHVVRKRMSGADLSAGLIAKPEVKAIDVLKGKGLSAPTSPRTPSPAASQLTHGSDMTALPAVKGDEASFSGCHGQRKASSTPEAAEAGDSATTADSAPHRKAAAAGGKAARACEAAKAVGAHKKLRRSARASEAAAASRLQQAARGAAAAPPPPTWAQTVPPAGGCVWGTPAMGVGATPAVYGYVSGSAGSYSAVGAMDTLAMQRCGSLVSNTSTLDSGLERASFDSSFSSFDSALDLGALDAELGCCDFPLDEALLPPDNPLFCFDAGLGPACGPAPHASAAAPPLPGVCAPIGLKLRKSASLLDLINSQLGAARCA